MISCDYNPCSNQIGGHGGYCKNMAISSYVNMEAVPGQICIYKPNKHGGQYYQIVIGRDINFKLAQNEISNLNAILTKITEAENV